jgi:hypothetical protein
MNEATPVRWLYGEDAPAAEKERRHAVEAKIDAWWQAFPGNTERIDALFRRKAKWDLPAWMHEHLQGISPHLMWEYGPGLSGKGHRLVITPEGARHLRPLTDVILSRAPKLDGWEFYPYRPPEDVKMATMTVEARTRGDLTDVMAHAAIGKHTLIDLTYYAPPAVSQEQARKDAFVATETLVGEERLDKWIGFIDAAPLPSAPKTGVVPLGKLRERVDALVEQVRDQAPPQPIWQTIEKATWTLFKLEPAKADDYPAQFDMFVGKSMNQGLWVAAHSRPAFHGERYTRCGETFCYVKLDGTQGLDQVKFADKSEIEDALTAVLKSAGLGCYIGGGTGLRYSYIDLALTDVKKGIAAVKDRLRAGNVPKRSWILFYDDYLAAEWVGVYPDSPPPPLPQWDK